MVLGHAEVYVLWSGFTPWLARVHGCACMAVLGCVHGVYDCLFRPHVCRICEVIFGRLSLYRYVAVGNCFALSRVKRVNQWRIWQYRYVSVLGNTCFLEWREVSEPV